MEKPISQGRVDAYVGKKIASGYNEDQTIGMMMLDLNLFYDQAKAGYNKAIKGIKKVR